MIAPGSPRFLSTPSRVAGVEIAFLGRAHVGRRLSLFFATPGADLLLELVPSAEAASALARGQRLALSYRTWPHGDGGAPSAGDGLPMTVIEALAARALSQEEELARLVTADEATPAADGPGQAGPGALHTETLDAALTLECGPRGAMDLDLFGWSFRLRGISSPGDEAHRRLQARALELVAGATPREATGQTVKTGVRASRTLDLDLREDPGPLNLTAPDEPTDWFVMLRLPSRCRLRCVFCDAWRTDSSERGDESTQPSQEPMIRDPEERRLGDASRRAGGRAPREGLLVSEARHVTPEPTSSPPTQPSPVKGEGAGRRLGSVLAELEPALGLNPRVRIVLHGDDVLEVPGFDTLLERVGDALPGAEIALITPGTRLSSPGEAARLVAAGVSRVSLTLLGPDAATHDALAGRPGAFDELSASLTAAREAGLEVELTVVALRDNLARLGAIFARAAGWGQRPRLTFFDERGARPALAATHLAPAGAIARALETGRDRIEPSLTSVRAAPWCALPAWARTRAEREEPVEPEVHPAPCQGCALTDQGCPRVGRGYLGQFGEEDLTSRT